MMEGEMVLQDNKETSDRTRGGEVRVNRGKARCLEGDVTKGSIEKAMRAELTF